MTLNELLTQALQEGCGQTKKKAQETAGKIIAWGIENGQAGIEHYWPMKLKNMSAKERDALIRRDFVGGNLQEVCKKYGCGRDTVYRALHNTPS